MNIPLRRVIIDLETTSLDINLNNILCVCCIDVDTLEETSFVNSNPDFLDDLKTYLSNYNLLIAHNGIRFDFNFLYKLNIPKFNIEDTLVLSKLIIPKNQLMQRDSQRKTIPKELIGSYSLKAFGYRLNNNKIEFNDFSKLSDELVQYCMQDCRVTLALYNILLEHKRCPNYDIRYMEYQVAYLMYMQEIFGFPFDIVNAIKLADKLETQVEEMKVRLQQLFPKRLVKDKECLTPKLADYSKSKGYKVVGPYTKLKLEEFNPSSRKQIYERLKDIWTPIVFTSKDNPIVNPDTLPKDNEICKELIVYLKTMKDLSQLKTGDNSWINLYNKETKRIHGVVDSLGANTHRMTHRNPNMTQLVKDKDFRSLYRIDKPYCLIGIDADALELMMLGHYLVPFGNKEFITAVAQGSKDEGNDIHTLNQHIMKLPSRNMAKTAIYGICYGIGGCKLARNIWNDEIQVEYTEEEYSKAKELLQQKVIGSMFQLDDNMLVPYTEELILQQIFGTQIKNNLIHNLKGYKNLVNQKSYEARYHKMISLIDKRKIMCLEPHKALNYLLQGSGAIFMKYYLLETCNLLAQNKFYLGHHYKYIANIHDAIVVETLIDYSEIICSCLEQAFINVSNKFEFLFPIKGKAVVGDNLYDIFI